MINELEIGSKLDDPNISLADVWSLHKELGKLIFGSNDLSEQTRLLWKKSIKKISNFVDNWENRKINISKEELKIMEDYSNSLLRVRKWLENNLKIKSFSPKEKEEESRNIQRIITRREKIINLIQKEKELFQQKEKLDQQNLQDSSPDNPYSENVEEKEEHPPASSISSDQKLLPANSDSILQEISQAQVQAKNLQAQIQQLERKFVNNHEEELSRAKRQLTEVESKLSSLQNKQVILSEADNKQKEKSPWAIVILTGAVTITLIGAIIFLIRKTKHKEHIKNKPNKNHEH